MAKIHYKLGTEVAQYESIGKHFNFNGCSNTPQITVSSTINITLILICYYDIYYYYWAVIAIAECQLTIAYELSLCSTR